MTPILTEAVLAFLYRLLNKKHHLWTFLEPHTLHYYCWPKCVNASLLKLHYSSFSSLSSGVLSEKNTFVSTCRGTLCPSAHQGALVPQSCSWETVEALSGALSRICSLHAHRWRACDTYLMTLSRACLGWFVSHSCSCGKEQTVPGQRLILPQTQWQANTHTPFPRWYTGEDCLHQAGGQEGHRGTPA